MKKYYIEPAIDCVYYCKDCVLYASDAIKGYDGGLYSEWDWKL